MKHMNAKPTNETKTNATYMQSTELHHEMHNSRIKKAAVGLFIVAALTLASTYQLKAAGLLEVICDPVVYNVNYSNIYDIDVKSNGIVKFDSDTGVFTKITDKETLINEFQSYLPLTQDLAYCIQQGAAQPQVGWKQQTAIDKLSEMYSLLFTVLSNDEFLKVTKTIPRNGGVHGNIRLKRPEKLHVISSGVIDPIKTATNAVKNFINEPSKGSPVSVSHEPVNVVDYLEMETICSFQFDRQTPYSEADYKKCMVQVDRVYDSMLKKQNFKNTTNPNVKGL